MGDLDVRAPRDDRERREFTQAVLRDLEAVARMLREDLFETGVQRVGAEQEMFLVDDAVHAAPLAAEVLQTADDPRLTHELALFNLEANLPPEPLDAGFLRALEASFEDAVGAVREAAAEHDARVVLTGILPTLRTADLRLENITPEVRYQQMNDALVAQAGGKFDIRIRGIDELEIEPESVMLEAANTSVQLHLQVDPADFAAVYNRIQLLTAPLLAAAVNSPVLLGRRLWQETRMALFEQSVDGRSRPAHHRGHLRRVSFGRDWVESSLLEIFRDNAVRYPALFAIDHDSDPLEALDRGEIPPLRALCLHNGTVWRWNRPCVGVGDDGVAHVRIENRVLPAGPSVLDQIANAALFYGLVFGLADEVGDPAGDIEFEQARANFFAAAREGLDAHFTWLGGRRGSARDLLLGELLPAARAGLRQLGVPGDDIDRYLGVMEERVLTGRTGSRWILDSLSGMRGRETPEVCFAAVTEELIGRGETGTPCHTWPLARLGSSGYRHRLVEDIMSTDLHTVRPTDPIDLAARAMEWNEVHHLPVETEQGELVGLITARMLLEARLAKAEAGDEVSPPIADVMDDDPVVVGPEVRITEAMTRLLQARTDCVLVVNARGELLGVVTEPDFVRASVELLSE